MCESKKNKNQARGTVGEGTEPLCIPVGSIVASQQVRSSINIENYSFKAPIESIKTGGILEPILVIPSDGTYRLLCGGRRLLCSPYSRSRFHSGTDHVNYCKR